MLQRPRRLRSTPALRALVSETRLTIDNLISPLFVKEGLKDAQAIASMPGVHQLPMSQIAAEAKRLNGLGIKSIILFGIPAKKDERGSGAHSGDGITQQAVKAIKDAAPDMMVITDVCLCEYTSHGHCGTVTDKGEIQNDPSLEILAETALSHVRAGADMVAPSDMMDGRVAAIRNKLDANGFENTPLMSYAVKYASAFYGPFRDVAESAPKFGDRKTYQMDAANAREALREAALDEAEGADIIMVKPAMTSLDIVSKLRERTHLPLAAYQVSGEYAMLHAAAQNGWLDLKGTAVESLTAIKRAGADLIVTYFAPDAAEWLA
jgi:porphobilinogen synthase